MVRKLTKKQKDFAKTYLKENGNATRAAEQVYNCKNNATARAIGSENLTKPNIQKEISDLIDQTEGGRDEEIIKRLIKRAKDETDKTNATRNDELLLKLKGKFNKEENKTTLKDFLNSLY